MASRSGPRSTAMPTGSTAGMFMLASARSSRYSRRARRSLMDFSAYSTPLSATKRTTCREIPRWRISTSRSSRHSSSGSPNGRVSRPAASSAGGLKTNLTTPPVIREFSDRQQRYAIVAETLVPGGDGQSFRERLSYQHAVERIVMVAGEPPGCNGVGDADRQRQKAAVLHLPIEVVRHSELSQRLLDRDLPRAGGRHHDKVGRIRDRVARLTGQVFAGQPPQQGVRVEEESHGRSPRNRSEER